MGREVQAAIQRARFAAASALVDNKKAAFRAASVEASYRLARNCSLAHACARHEVKLASQNFESPIVGPVVNDYDFQRGVGEQQQGPHCLRNYSLLVPSQSPNDDWRCSSRDLS